MRKANYMDFETLKLRNAVDQNLTLNERANQSRGNLTGKTMSTEQAGITLVALVVTIVVLLILAGVCIAMVVGDNGILNQASNAADKTIVADEKEKIEMAYLSAFTGQLGANVTESDLQAALDKVAATYVSDNGDDTLNVFFSDTNHNYNVSNGSVTRVADEDPSKIAIFDTGMNVFLKMASIIPSDATLTFQGYPLALGVDGIKKYAGTPDLTQMTDANIVSLGEAPSSFSSLITEETELCTIYVWFVESGNQKYRGIYGNIYEDNYSGADDELHKNVTTGTLYWWCETKNVYLNPVSSYMFAFMPYLSDIGGLAGFKTEYTTNMSRMFVCFGNKSLTNVNALANWNTSNVTDMRSLFEECSSLGDISGLSNWDTSSVTDMSYLFADTDDGSYSLSNLSPLSSWDVSSVTNMSGLFYGCRMTNLDALKTWNVSKVSSMDCMFYNCVALEDTSGINDWDVTNVTSFAGMFGGTSASLCPTFSKVSGTWDENGTFTKD